MSLTPPKRFKIPNLGNIWKEPGLEEGKPIIRFIRRQIRKHWKKVGAPVYNQKMQDAVDIVGTRVIATLKPGEELTVINQTVYNPHHIAYLARKLYPHSQEQQALLIESVISLPLHSTQSGDIIQAIKHAAKTDPRLRFRSKTTELIAYVQGEGEKNLSKKLGLRVENPIPATDITKFKSKTAFTRFCKENKIPTVPHSVCVEDGHATSLTIADALQKLFGRFRCQVIFIRKALSASGDGNATITRDGREFTFTDCNGISKTFENSENLTAHIRHWNSGNNAGLVFAPKLETLANLSCSLYINGDDHDSPVSESFICREITTNSRYEASEFGTICPEVIAPAEELKAIIIEKLRAIGFKGKFQYDFVVYERKGKLVAVITESNFARTTAPQQYIEVLERIAEFRGKTLNHISPIRCSDHLKTDAESFQEIDQRLSNIPLELVLSRVASKVREKTRIKLNAVEAINFSAHNLISLDVHKLSAQEPDPNNVGLVFSLDPLFDVSRDTSIPSISLSFLQQVLGQNALNLAQLNDIVAEQLHQQTE